MSGGRKKNQEDKLSPPRGRELDPCWGRQEAHKRARVLLETKAIEVSERAKAMALGLGNRVGREGAVQQAWPETVTKRRPGADRAFRALRAEPDC